MIPKLSAGTAARVSARALVAMVALGAAFQASAQNSTPPSAPAGSSAFMYHSWLSALNAPGPAALLLAEQGIGSTIPANEANVNAYGLLYSYQPAGATSTATNAFFQSLGTNGRSCATCHQPASGMSVSLPDILARYVLSGPKDPIFAPVDGAVCPSAVPAANTSPSYLGGHRGSGASLAKAYSLLLTRGVFRIFLPVPAGADFTIAVASDPTGCNTNSTYNQVTSSTGAVTQIISVYRRPLISANLKFKTIGIDNNFPFIIAPADPLDGTPLTVDANVGDYEYLLPENGNIMWDGREATLETQAMDATLGHAQATTAPTPQQIAEMVSFETGIYNAEGFRFFSGDLTSQSGATGGPVNLFDVSPGQVTALAGGGITPYTSFSSVTGTTATEEQQESIARGQVIFNTRTFTVSNVAGLTNIGAIGNNATGTCTLCHNQVNDGADAFPVAQHDLGVGGDIPQFGGNAPATDLPIFKITCNGLPNPYYSGSSPQVIMTNDPGKALITGKCADVGRTTVPQLRALASHQPYFHDGSAASLSAVVAFYQKRFPTLVLSTQDQTDLVNFLASL